MKFLNDPGVAFEVSGRISDKSKNLIKPQLNYMQARMTEIVRFCREHGVPCRIINLKPRQKGSSTFSVWLGYCLASNKPVSGMVIGGEHSQGANLLGMMRTYAQNDPFSRSCTVNQRVARWDNGSTFHQSTARNFNAGRSGTYQFLLATEVARWSEEGVANAADVLSGILKTVPPVEDTVVILESTARGATGDFYERYQGALSFEDFKSAVEAGKLPENSYIKLFTAWFEFADSAIKLTDAQRGEIMDTLDASQEYFGEKELMDRFMTTAPDGTQRLGSVVEGVDVWEQLAWRRWAIREECKRDAEAFEEDYPSDEDSAFRKSGRLRFNKTGLRILNDESIRWIPKFGILTPANESSAAFVATDNEADAYVWMYEEAREQMRYIIGVDVATGASQTSGADPDNHGVLVVRAGYWDDSGRWHRSRVVARLGQMVRGKQECCWDIDVLAEHVILLARLYGNCKIVPEVNGPGLSFIEAIKNNNLQIYQRRLFNRKEDRLMDMLGWETTAKSRSLLVETLARAIRNWDVDGEGVEVFCPWVRAELGNFVVASSGKAEAAQGKHDDQVMALGLALVALDQATVYRLERRRRQLPDDLRGMFAVERASSYS